MMTSSKFCAVRLAAGLISLLPVFAWASQSALQVYVSPTGNDANAGLSPTTPVATIAQAIQVVEVQRNLTTTVPAVINLAAGQYRLATALLFHPVDSNLTVLGPAGASAIVSGGVQVKGWSKYIPANLRQRMSASALNGVYSAVVPLSNLGAFQRRGGSEPGTAFQNQPAELFVGGVPMSLARFPASGWATASSVAGDGVTATLNMNRRVAAFRDAWVQGFWSTDSWETWEPLTSAPSTSQIQVNGLQSGGNMGPITSGARFAIVNSLEDLNQPGQYYIDRLGGRAYFYPISSASIPNADLSQVDGFLADVFQCNNLVFQNVVFQESRGQGVQFYGCTNCGLTSCTVQGTQLEGVYLTGGTNNFVTNCDISNTGSCGIFSIEGDLTTLTSGGDQITNNVISSPGRMENTYRPAVWVRGVGATVSSNTILDCPGQAIVVGGCNHLITENDISHTCTTMSDVGVIYSGDTIVNQGNVVSLNIIHDVPAVVASRLGSPVIVGMYLDDFSSGFTVQENIFYNIGAGVYIGGGRSNNIYSNAFDNVQTPVWIDARGMNWASGYYQAGGSFQTQIAAMSPTQFALFEATYPCFLSWVTASNPALPEGNSVNYAYFPTTGVGVLYYDPTYTQPLLQTANLLYNGNSIFTNPAAGNYTLVAGANVSTQLPTSAGSNGVSGAIRSMGSINKHS